MASVFLSYDRDDADRARPLALALQKAGHSVWWDLHVRSGAQFSKVIEEALKAADAVVVLWSVRSVESAWVRDEAAAGRDSGRLVPVSLDETDPPLGFRQFQTIDLSRWKGRGKPPELRTLFADVASMARAPVDARTTPPPVSPTLATSRPRIRVKPLLVLVAILVALVAGVAAWKLIDRRSAVPVVAVASTDASSASEALARDLLVKLGTLQTRRHGSIDLVSLNDTAKKPNLIFKVGRSGGGRVAEGNLTLTDARNRSLLWSKDFHDPNGNEADLRQQLSYTAANVLGCALEGMDAGRLSRQALKTYLNACAMISEVTPEDVAGLISPLQRLVREEPQFAGGWAKLLLAETDAATNPVNPDADALRPVLARHIVEARKLHPNLAEGFIAEYALTPDAEFLNRSRLLNEGIERNPDSPELRYARSLFLQSVGRMDEALQDARRATELDSLSPAMREGYISALAFAGRQDEALVELNEAERLWPGSTILQGASYRLHLRTGDPREALRLLRAGALQNALTDWMRVQEALLEARIDRSPENVDKAIRAATAIYNRIPQGISLLSQTLVELDREEELFPILLNWRRMDIVTYVTEVLFRPKFSDFHKDPRFMQVAKRLGLLDYWRASGKWPDFCSRADLPYDCKAEAAKLA